MPKAQHLGRFISRTGPEARFYFLQNCFNLDDIFISSILRTDALEGQICCYL